MYVNNAFVCINRYLHVQGHVRIQSVVMRPLNRAAPIIHCLDMTNLVYGTMTTYIEFSEISRAERITPLASLDKLLFISFFYVVISLNQNRVCGGFTKVHQSMKLFRVWN